MKRLAILAFVLGAFVAPAQAQTQKPLEFNGMIFDSPSAASSYAAPNYVALGRQRQNDTLLTSESTITATPQHSVDCLFSRPG
jgi:hypothetical protein